MRNVLMISLLAILAGAALFVYFGMRPNDAEVATPQTAAIDDARRFFESGNFRESLQAAAAMLESDAKPSLDDLQRGEAAMIAGESATKLDRLDEALRFYAQVPNSAPQAAVAKWASAEILFHQGRLTPTFAALQNSLQLDPELAYAHERMIDACNTVSRRYDSLPHLMFMVRSNRIRPEYLMLMGNLDKETGATETLKQFRSRSPEDLLPNLGLARLAISDGKFTRAAELLAALLEQQPQLVEAHAQLGICYLQIASEKLPDWHTNLPPRAEQHPEVWFVRGQWLREGDQRDAAIRCFAEAIRRDANHLKSHQALAQLLQLQGHSAQAAKFAAKAELLQQINTSLEQFYNSKTLTPLIKDLAELTLQVGRIWECLGWCGYGQSLDSSLTWPAEIATQATSQFPISPSTPRTLPAFNLVSNNSYFDQFPLADFSSLGTEKALNRDIEEEATATSNIRFRDIAEEAGLVFRFDNNVANQREGRRIFEHTGGGVGVIDFDADGRPDLFFSQGGTFSESGDYGNNQDALFRSSNSQNNRYTPVSNQARLTDKSFGQGVAVGDVNADGFDDIFVCNIGRNQLWLNAGDGTFHDASLSLPSDSSWTSSAAILDLDLDGLPEIYEANYVFGSDVFTKMCTIGGKPRACGPLVFSPAEDRVLTSDQSGLFRNLKLSPEMLGNSLGVVAFMLENAERPSAFVAVDQQANLLATPTATASESTMSFREDAVVRGLAYDNAGNAQACMGVAAGDVNGDGAVDLFVTNFYLEYYTLYIQEQGLFRDATATSGTIPETKPLLGFGTQFLDAQLDGTQDLFVLNGHIDDHTHIGVPEKMPAQFFLGSGDGRFTLFDENGDFFSRPRLGRALAKLDFNRDGMMDLVFNDLESPVSLVRNESVASGSFISLRLVGTQSDRNAFCTTAEIRIAGGDPDAAAASSEYRQSQQLISGSGYHASNERMLHFSLPHQELAANHKSSLKLVIRWPSGVVEEYDGLQMSSHYTAIEGGGLHLTP